MLVKTFEFSDLNSFLRSVGNSNVSVVFVCVVTNLLIVDNGVMHQLMYLYKNITEERYICILMRLKRLRFVNIVQF
jgi:hypothetical protein